MALLVLDFSTGILTPMPGLDPLSKRRAEWTCATLGLNQRRLPRARKKAYTAFRGMLRDYMKYRDAGRSGVADTVRTDIVQYDHPTVLREMFRQREAEPELKALFASIPEAAGWW